jgi:hypothetical protein
VDFWLYGWRKDEEMSYDISLCDPVTHETLEVDDTHFVAGGTRPI